MTDTPDLAQGLADSPDTARALYDEAGSFFAGRPHIEAPSQAVRNVTIKILEGLLYHHKHWDFTWDNEMLFGTYPAEHGVLKLVLQTRPQVLWLALVPDENDHIQVIREPFFYRSLKQAVEAIGERLAGWRNPKVYDLFGTSDEEAKPVPEVPTMEKVVALCDWKPVEMMAPLLDRTNVMGKDSEGVGKVMYLKKYGFLPRQDGGPPITEWAYLPEGYTWEKGEAVTIESLNMDMGDFI